MMDRQPYNDQQALNKSSQKRTVGQCSNPAGDNMNSSCSLMSILLPTENQQRFGLEEGPWQYYTTCIP